MMLDYANADFGLRISELKITNLKIVKDTRCRMMDDPGKLILQNIVIYGTN